MLAVSNNAGFSVFSLKLALAAVLMVLALRCYFGCLFTLIILSFVVITQRKWSIFCYWIANCVIHAKMMMKKLKQSQNVVSFIYCVMRVMWILNN
jgi:hypothetical protein